MALLGFGASAFAATTSACELRAPAAAPRVLARRPTVTATSQAGTLLGPPKAYNWKAANTRRLTSSLGSAETGRVNHVFIGDSMTAGFLGGSETPQYDALIAWPRIYRSHLSSAGTPIGGTGVVPCSSGDAPYDSRWTRSAGWDAGWAYALFTSTSGETATFVSDTPGTEVSVYYLGASTGMSITIDGGADIALPTDGATHTSIFTVSDLPNTVHTVTVTTTASSYNQLIGASVQVENGLLCHNIAVGGATVSGPKLAAWATSTPLYINPTLVGALTAQSITPDVVYVALGANDIRDGYATSDIITALATLRNQFSDSDFVLIGQAEINGFQSVWASWLSELRDLADSLDCPLVDLYARYGEYRDAVADGLMGDGVHPNAKAQNDIGTIVASLACSST